MAEIITTQKLIDADIDVDNLGKAANELGIVNPRYGNPYKTAPQAIQDLQQKADQVVAQGFYQGYATEALLLAAKPAASEMRARADDTRKIYRWNRTSAEGVTPITGNWVDTGLSDKDLAAADATTKANAAEANAKAYTDNLETSRQYYTNSSFSVADFYVASATGLLVSSIEFNSTDFIYVEPNTAYKFNVATGASSGCAFYDGDKKYISGFGNNGVAGTDYTVTTPNNARYVRLSNRKTNTTPYFKTDGRYNIQKILSIVNAFPPIVPIKNIPVGADNLAQELVRLNDPMHSEKVVISKEQLNTVNANGLSDRAYPIGRRVYDHSLRREVIADGSFWRLPDGRPASLEPRVYVYPDWDEIRAALPTYAKAYKKVFTASSTVGWAKATASNQTTSFKHSTEMGFNSIYIEDGAQNDSSFVYYNNANPIGLNSHLIFKAAIDWVNTFRFRVGLFDASGTLLFYKNLQTLDMGTAPRDFYVNEVPDIVRIEMKVSSFTSAIVGASLEDVAGIGFQVSRKAGTTARAWVGELDTVTFKPMITLRFDDQRQSVYTHALPIMQQYGFNGLIAVITGAPELANDPNVHYPLVGMTKAQCLEVRSLGWDLVSHTHTHPQYEQQTDEYMRDDYRKSVKYLREELNAGDIASSCLVSPYNRRNERIAQVQREFFDAQINQSSLINSCMPRQPEGTWQTGSLWTAMGSAKGDTNNAATLISYAQEAIDKERWQVIMLHDIMPANAVIDSNTHVNSEDFAIFCAWLDEHRDEIDVVTVTDVVRRIRPVG